MESTAVSRMINNKASRAQILNANQNNGMLSMEDVNKTRSQISARIDAIINEVNISNIAGRSKRYVGGCACKGGLIDDSGVNAMGNVNGGKGKKNLLHLDYDMVDEDGILRQIRSAEGYDLDDVTVRPRVGSGVVGGNGIHNETSLGAGAPKRKPRIDKGKKRKPSEWLQFVRAVQDHEGVTYKEAMSMASKYKAQGYVAEDFM